ncbi:hypothetical protein [Undibacterium pigrum]|uniref:Uncharacterized protein n=1 Tax=Undibacterium pigrum TaxID=401470 RepID=A0A318J5M2_9BURK|nr:hypothetical protein [Undibacterium pigrum]PXX41657.1 hypothetical protein DFR42_107309 [Undibacterium pigrum]
MKVHIVENGLVINMIEVESVERARYLFPNLICIVDSKATIGFVYDGEKLTEPKTSKEDQRKLLSDEIISIEREDGCNRKIRELLLKLSDANDFPYKKLKEIDNKIAKLRTRLQEIGD